MEKFDGEGQNFVYFDNSWYFRNRILILILILSIGVFVFYDKILGLVFLFIPLASWSFKSGHKKGFVDGYEMSNEDLKDKK